MSETPFDRLARFYDWEHAGYLDDLPLYRGLAERVGGPILEAACGSGRLLLPLARSGYEVVGLDTSPPMLRLAEAALAREPALADRVHLVEGDLRTTRLGRQFGLAIVALDSFGLLVEQHDQLRALASLRRHIHDDGLLVLDLANGNLRGGETSEETVLHRYGTLPDAGPSVVKWSLRRTDHSLQLDHFVLIYDETGAHGVVRRTLVELDLRYFTRFELELLLDRAGFFLEALFGDYDLNPFAATSPRLIAVAHVNRKRR